MELACDETVVATFGEKMKSSYALALISMEERKSRLTPMCNNFSKNSIEERIESIMKFKKNTILSLILAVGLVGGTTLVFATSAFTPNNEVKNITNLNDVSITLNKLNEETGKYEYSMDGGLTWISKEEYEKDIPAIEWWTYEEYKAWMEEEIKGLQSIAGDGKPDYYDKDGVLREYTKKDLKEIEEIYKDTLESIKNGNKVSKSVNGNEDISIVYNNNDTEIESAYGIVITTESGEVIDVGSFNSEEELLEALEPYCKKLVEEGKITQKEADEILKKYR